MKVKTPPTLLALAIRTTFASLPLTSVSLISTTLYAVENVNTLASADTLNQPEPNLLPTITVIASAEQDGSVENGYVVKQLKQVGPWGAKDLKDTPYSVSVISSDLIQNAVAGDMDQIYKMNPVIQNSAPSTVYGTPYAAIRGFHTQSGVMDGLRLSSTSTGIAMEELDRVEIMNGLTGFMYGVGNVGGTTNYVLKRPTYEKLSNLTLGNYGNQQWFGHVDLGNKIDDEGQFAYRFNASYQNGETGKKNQNIERTLISGAIDWNVNDDLLLQLEGAHTEYKLDGIDSRFYAYANSNFGALDYWIKPLKNDKTYTPDWTYLDIKTDRIGLNANYKINDQFSLRSAYMLKKDTQESINLYPAYYADAGYVNGWVSRSAPSENIAQGAYTYLDSLFNTFGIQHKLTVGLSGDFLETKQHVISSKSAANSPAFIDPNDLISWEKPTGLDGNDWGRKYKSADNSNYNVIIGDDIQFNNQWNALIGLNYTTIKTKNYDTAGKKTSSYDKSKLTPTVSLIYKPLEKLTTYASYMEGLEKGSTVPLDSELYNEPGKILNPTISTQYELGAKYAFSDRLLLSSALFRIEKANNFEERTPNGKININQDGLQIHQGLEITLTGKLTDNLTVMTGGTLMDLEIDQATNKMLEGKKPTGASDTLVKLYTEYNIPQIQGLTLTGGAYYTGNMYKDSLNQQEIDGYTIFDLGARYKTSISSIPTTFNLNIANLTGKDYWATTYSLGIPRTISFSVKTEF
ncbi:MULTISPECIES: TonB-dependent siderophore receptor [Acinetobacter]|jgi:iron complex outermembrane receptor protein|uniref:TonB-dependent siderophore receptor n=2 Tax=Acinetobacter TaxID=469 RepID=A0A4Q7AU64_9GAMM|nr:MULTISPECIES: TonB-dependent siderophore receptor [Acinetobacter]MCW8038981.1 TonB-dependent siderophore receptor [Acinetobacter entericus]RZG65905.1 TonB-dependent siderophore receptor [Acinetobacter bouvetii]TCB74517.1 TonB-dependent siderophore receptor [Acinetobacter sp. ANC 4177]